MMPKLTTASSIIEPDLDLLKKLVWVKRASLAAVAWIAAITLAGWLLPALGRLLPNGWQLMKPESALAALLSVLCLLFAAPKRSRRLHRLSLILAVLVTLMGAVILAGYGLQTFHAVDKLPLFARGFSPRLAVTMTPQTAAGFALLGMQMLLIRARNRLANQVADLFAFFLGMLLLVLVSGYAFGAMRMFGLSTTVMTSPQSLVCLLLLTLAAILRRAENSVFSIFLGRGIGSRIARVIAPILLVLPFLREIGRAHMMQAQRIPEQYATAILASVATMLAFVLLLILAWRINSMEMEIHDLSLRDALTGLYNLRGFYLLAEQSRRLANRNQLPFSVLYIDVDNLKQINDSFGHNVGSAFLAETAEIIGATFRETDVLGRIGGDEFAVASQFSQDAVATAAERLQAACTSRNRETGRQFTLSFSVGYATSVEQKDQSLEDMLAEADKAMYQEKRRKKILLD
jgi:diguanylate cyclase (GGDEF)-like protein